MAMPPLTPTPPPFSVPEAFLFGCRFAVRHIRLIAVLSFFPLFLTLGTLVGLRLSNVTLSIFWLPIVQLPASFVIGLQCALLLRFFVLHEYPIIPDGPERAQRNRAVSQAAFIYAAITYFVTGAVAVLFKLWAFISKNPEANSSYMPLAIILIVGILWGMRWFWLHVPVALDWPVRAFFERLGKWGGTLRVFALVALSSMLVNIVGGFLTALIMALGGKEPNGLFQALGDVVLAVSTVAQAVIFTASTAAAVKLMTGAKPKDIEA